MPGGDSIEDHLLLIVGKAGFVYDLTDIGGVAGELRLQCVSDVLRGGANVHVSSHRWDVLGHLRRSVGLAMPVEGRGPAPGEMAQSQRFITFHGCPKTVRDRVMEVRAADYSVTVAVNATKQMLPACEILFSDCPVAVAITGGEDG